MRIFAAGMICALLSTSALISSAEAKPRHHRHHVAKHHHVKHVRHKAKHRFVVRPQVEPSNFGAPSFPSFLSHTDDIVQKARSYIGAGAVFGRSSLWCARFMNVVLEKTGHRGTGSDMAKSFLAMPATAPRVGAIAVMGRGKRGGHVGVVSGFDAKGNPIIVSGNHGNRVAESVYSRSRIIKFVSPS
jgi:uncharacterized protein (TIGR02594 family)